MAVLPTTHSLTVLPPKPGLKDEPVATNLIASLINRERKAGVRQLAFSPDGTRLFASGYPSGVVQIWDVAARQEIRRIETPPSYRGTAEYALLTPDWKTLYVPVEKRTFNSFVRDDKRLNRFDYSGQIRVWDLGSGKEKDSLQPGVGLAPSTTSVSPNGQYLVCNEQQSYDSSKPAPDHISVVWDLATGTKRKLIDGHTVVSFFPDGKTAAVQVYSSGGWTRAVQIFDLATGKELIQASFQNLDAGTRGMGTVSPDGAVIALRLTGKNGEQQQVWFLDGKTLVDRGKLVGKANHDGYGFCTGGVFTPDGKRYVALDGAGSAVIWDVARQKVERTLPLGDELDWWRTAVSADGKTLAVAWAPKGDEDQADLTEPDPRDLPQPRVTLVPLDGSAAPRTLIAPQGYVGALAFSPDGKTLAFGGAGAVHLFDLTK